MYLRCFDDVYGFRAMCEGFGKNLYYLSPWEFLMLWECLPLPQPKKGNHADKDEASLSVPIGEEGDFGPNPAAESKEVIFFPEGIPGPHKLRSRWYLRRRRRPMVPRPTNTRMPDQEKDAERRSKLYSLYLRPWTLHSGKFFFCIEHPHNDEFQLSCFSLFVSHVLQIEMLSKMLSKSNMLDFLICWRYLSVGFAPDLLLD